MPTPLKIVCFVLFVAAITMIARRGELKCCEVDASSQPWCFRTCSPACSFVFVSRPLKYIGAFSLHLWMEKHRSANSWSAAERPTFTCTLYFDLCPNCSYGKNVSKRQTMKLLGFSGLQNTHDALCNYEESFSKSGNLVHLQHPALLEHHKSPSSQKRPDSLRWKNRTTQLGHSREEATTWQLGSGCCLLYPVVSQLSSCQIKVWL